MPRCYCAHWRHSRNIACKIFTAQQFFCAREFTKPYIYIYTRNWRRKRALYSSPRSFQKVATKIIIFLVLTILSIQQRRRVLLYISLFFFLRKQNFPPGHNGNSLPRIPLGGNMYHVNLLQRRSRKKKANGLIAQCFTKFLRNCMREKQWKHIGIYKTHTRGNEI